MNLLVKIIEKQPPAAVGRLRVALRATLRPLKGSHGTCQNECSDYQLTISPHIMPISRKSRIRKEEKDFF